MVLAQAGSGSLKLFAVLFDVPVFVLAVHAAARRGETAPTA